VTCAASPSGPARAGAATRRPSPLPTSARSCTPSRPRPRHRHHPPPDLRPALVLPVPRGRGARGARPHRADRDPEGLAHPAHRPQRDRGGTADRRARRRGPAAAAGPGPARAGVRDGRPRVGAGGPVAPGPAVRGRAAAGAGEGLEAAPRAARPAGAGAGGWPCGEPGGAHSAAAGACSSMREVCCRVSGVGIIRQRHAPVSPAGHPHTLRHTFATHLLEAARTER
jgi:hypothetical protein